MLAKLENSFLRFAPNIISKGKVQIINPHDDILKAEGYKEVMFADYPDDGKYYVSSYRETDTQIIQEWTETEPPVKEPTPEGKIAELEKQVADLSTTLVNQI